MITNFLILLKKSPPLALLNSKRLEISPKNGWRARVLVRRSFSEGGAGESMVSFPNWRSRSNNLIHSAAMFNPIYFYFPLQVVNFVNYSPVANAQTPGIFSIS